jgi:hypothetical protein
VTVLGAGDLQALRSRLAARYPLKKVRFMMT